MKILAITPSIPYPSRSGSTIIAYNHIKHLALAGHSIDLCTFRWENQTDYADLLEYCQLKFSFLHPNKFQKYSRFIKGIFQDLPISVSHYESPQAKKEVAQLCLESNYDAVYCQLTEMAQFVPDKMRAISLVSIEDPIALKHARMQDWRSNQFVKWLWHYEILRIIRYENRLKETFGSFVLLNKDDAFDFSSLIQTKNVEWVNYGVDTDYFSFSEQPRDAGTVVITGNMFHPPNVLGIIEFCKNVFPLVQSQMPNVTLWLVGANPVDAIRELHNGTSIHVTGFVDDIRPYLYKAQVSVCPVTLKIGTQTKILEAMACGTPVVTTTGGNNGIGGIHGRDIFVGNSPREMADNIVSILRNDKWQELSIQSRRFVVANFSWATNVKKLEQILLRLCQK